MSDATTDASTEVTDTETETDTTDWKAEAEKWQSLARKHEDRAKQNSAAAKELEQFRQQTMTEQEKAVAQAATEARNAAMVEFATQLVDAKLEAAAAGRLESDQLSELLSNLDRSKFITDDGAVDSDRISAFVERLAPKADTPLDLGQGTRTAPALNGDPLLRDLKAKLGIR